MANSSNSINVEKICSQIEGRFVCGKFDPFIQFIEFPKYKNFQQRMRVNFDFTLTVIVGQNGTGKSSFLQAMYGAASGLQPGRWWFGTALDPMDEDELIRTEKSNRLKESDRAAFWYRYKTAENSIRSSQSAGSPSWRPRLLGTNQTQSKLWDRTSARRSGFNGSDLPQFQDANKCIRSLFRFQRAAMQSKRWGRHYSGAK